MDALADVCEARDVWLHVDGAYGIAAASTYSGHLFAGVERADSVTLDAHKWLSASPRRAASCSSGGDEDLHGALARGGLHPARASRPPRQTTSTLRHSRPFRALKLWLAFRAHGAAAIRAAIERNLGQARLLHAEVSRYDDLEVLCAEPPLSVVPFRHVPDGVEDLDEHNAGLVEELQRNGDVWVAPARVDGKVCLRPCVVNYARRTTTSARSSKLARESARHSCEASTVSNLLGHLPWGDR